MTCVINSPSTSKGWKGVNYTCFLKMDSASEISRIKHGQPLSSLCLLLYAPFCQDQRKKPSLSDLTFFICYPVNIRLITHPQFPKKRNIQGRKGTNEILKMEQDQNQFKLETPYCLKKYIILASFAVKISIRFKVCKRVHGYLVQPRLASNFKF